MQYEDGTKALFVAIKNGDEEITRMLLEAGVNVNAQDEHGNSPLHLAVTKEGGGTLLRLLLENDADTEIENKSGRTPLQKAISDRKGKALELLLKYGAHFPADQSHTFFRNELHILANRNNGIDYQKLKRFCYKDRLAFIEATNNRLVALQESLERWHVPAVLHTVILQLSDQPDFRFERFNRCRLPQAALRGQAEEVAEQLSQGAIDPQSENCKLSLCMAAARGHDAIVRILLDTGVSPDTLIAGASPLHWAVLENHETTVQLLLNEGANVHIQNSRKQTPLHYAAEHGAMVELLIAQGAHINAQDNDHQTPLHKTVSNGHVRATRILLTNGADTSLTDSQGSTALHVAVRSDHPNKSDIIAIVQALLEAGCEVNAQDNYGYTALHHAVGDDRNECIISLLLRAGANPEVVDIHGNTSLALASPLMRNLLWAWIRSRQPLPLSLPLLLPLG